MTALSDIKCRSLSPVVENSVGILRSSLDQTHDSSRVMGVALGSCSGSGLFGLDEGERAGQHVF